MPEYRRRKTVGARPNGSSGASFSGLVRSALFQAKTMRSTKCRPSRRGSSRGVSFKRTPLALSRDGQLAAMQVNRLFRFLSELLRVFTRHDAALRYEKMCRFTEPPQMALCDVTIETKIFKCGRIVGWSHGERECCGPL